MSDTVSRRAFTLIEMIVVLAISALLSGIAITYSSIGRNEVALSVEAAKISQFILQAKALSVATFTGVGGAASSCGYGMVLNAAAGTYSIFAYAPTGALKCPDVSAVDGIATSEEKEYTQGTWNVPLSPGVKLVDEADSLVTVLFYPPDPTVFISHDGAVFLVPAVTQSVHLSTVDNKNTATISVNPDGQVSF